MGDLLGQNFPNPQSNDSFSLFYLCFLGTGGVSLPHHFYCGSIFKSHSLWAALSPQCLPPQRLELAGFYHCGCRVSTATPPPLHRPHPVPAPSHPYLCLWSQGPWASGQTRGSIKNHFGFRLSPKGEERHLEQRRPPLPPAHAHTHTRACAQVNPRPSGGAQGPLCSQGDAPAVGLPLGLTWHSGPWTPPLRCGRVCLVRLDGKAAGTWEPGHPPAPLQGPGSVAAGTGQWD